MLMSEHLTCLCLLLEEYYFHKKLFYNFFELGRLWRVWDLYGERMGLQKVFACFGVRMLNDFIYT